MLDVIYGQASRPGRVWPRNADAAAAFIPRSRQEMRSKGWLFVVADGRGSTALGPIASRCAVETMVAGFTDGLEGPSLASLMPRLVERANSKVHHEALTPDYRGQRVETTIAGCALRDAIAVVCHVGDSRCYHVRNHGITVVTQDHTAIAEQAGAGTITAMQAEHSENRHVLKQSLGPELSVSPQIESFGILPGDVIVLCTDGLYEAIYPEDIARIVSDPKHPGLLAHELVAYAIEADGSDNVTAQVIRVHDPDPLRDGAIDG